MSPFYFEGGYIMNRVLDSKFDEIIEVSKRQVTSRDKMRYIFDIFREVRNCTKPETITNDISLKVIELYKIADSQGEETDWNEVLDAFYTLYYDIDTAIIEERGQIEIFIIEDEHDVWKAKRATCKLDDLRSIAGKALGKI